MQDSNKTKPPSPGEVLNLEFMQPRGISQNALARAMKVSPRRVNLIVHGQRVITADTAIRLSLVLGTSAKLWLDLQTAHDLERAKHAFQDELPALP
jgi:addiction module HigA family antidote